MKKSLLIILFFILSQSVYSQNPETLKTWQLKQYAQSALQQNNFYIAADFYKELSDRKPKDLKIKYELAMIYYNLRNFEESRILFYDIYQEQKYKSEIALFYYAEISKVLGDYSTAKIYFEQFNDLKNIDDFVEYKYLAELALEGIEMTKDTSFQKDFLVQNLNTSINTPHLETSPIIISDSAFIYSSFGIDSIKVINKNAQNCPTSKYYFAKFENGEWKGGYTAGKPFFNLPNRCTANGAFSPDKKRFYFTIKEINRRGLAVSHLYVAKYNDTVWSASELLGNNINVELYNSTQPTIGTTYKSSLEIIYFVSDRKGGWGGKDIWFSVYDKIHDTYTEPINAGGYINTLGDEMTPFYNIKNKTMYFSSNGLAGFGGFDVYKTIGELSNWIPATNVGSPLNSSFDEFYFSINSNQTNGFFISNRNEALDWGNENCCFDIFNFDMLSNNNLIITGQLKAPDENIFQDINQMLTSDSLNDTTKYIKNAVVDLIIHNTDDSTYLALFSDTTDNQGNFSFSISRGYDFSMSVNAQGYSFSTCTFSTNYNFQDTLDLDCIKVEPKYNGNIVLENILFEFNSATLTDSSKTYVDSVIVPVMKKYDNIIVEISAHTDKVGSSDYNLSLSQDRAQSVVDRVINAGISPDKIIAKGYGETRPRMCETFADGSDNAFSRKQNRRVEFKIIGFVDNN